MRALSTSCIVAIMTLLILGPQLYAQTEKEHIRSGNKEYEAGKYEDAEKSYRAAIDENTNSLEGSFNLGDAAYKQENYDDAINQFELLSKKVGTPEQVAQAYHNLGNSYLGKKEYEKGVEAYKQALRNDPQDMDTRYNLAYAQQKLKQQQQQQKEEKKEDNEDEKKKDEEKKEEEEKKDEDKKDEEKKDEEKKEDQKKGDEDKDQKEKSSKPDQLSKEEAKKILEALKNKEMDVQDKLKKQKLKATKVKVDKDW